MLRPYANNTRDQVLRNVWEQESPQAECGILFHLYDISNKSG